MVNGEGLKIQGKRGQELFALCVWIGEFRFEFSIW